MECYIINKDDWNPIRKAMIDWGTTVSLGGGNGTPLQYSCLENPMDGGAWWAAVNGVAKGRTRLSNFTFTFHFPALEKEMATHSSVLAWRIPGMGEPGGLPSMGSHRVVHDWRDLALCHYLISLSLNSTYLYVSLNSPPSWSPVLKQFHHLKNHTTIVFIFFFYIKINFLVFQGLRLHQSSLLPKTSIGTKTSRSSNLFSDQ